MNHPPQALSFRTIARFWYPLAGSWLLMAAEGPLIAAIIARMGHPALDLAAYGVAYALALVTEAPILMLMSASTSLVRDGGSYRQLRSFSFLLCFGVTALLLSLCFPPLFDSLALGAIGLDPEVAERTHGALLLLLPWPAAIGMRRFWHGILIRSNQTRRVAIGTAIRFSCMAGSALLLFHFSELDGARIGGAALTIGVVTEALAIRLLAAGAIRRVCASTVPHPHGAMTFRALSAYYFPLAMTPVLALSVQPLITFFLCRALFPVESLAVMPVVNSLTFLFRAVGLSYQEVVLALMGERFVNYRKLRDFGLYLGVAATLPLVLIAFTPLSTLWLEGVSGLPPALAAFAIAPLCIQAILPALTLTQAMQRSVLLEGRVTTPISVATALETVSIFLILLVLVRFAPFSGAVIAAIALVIGRLLGIALMARPQRIVLHEQMDQQRKWVVMEESGERRARAWMILAAAMLWGTTGTAQALAPSGAQPLTVGALRLVIGGLTLLGIALGRRAFTGSGSWPLRSTVAAAVLVALYQLTFFAAVAKTGVAVGTIVGIGSAPVAAGLLGRFFRGEELSRRWLVATGLAVAGCTLLALNGGGELRIDPLGIFLAIGAGISYAGYTLAVKNLLPGRSPDAVMAVVFCLGALLLSPFLLTSDIGWLLQPRGLAVALHLGVIATALSYWFFARGLLTVPVSTAVTLSLAEPLTATLLGVVVLNEQLTPIAFGGIVLIFSGLAVLAWKRRCS